MKENENEKECSDIYRSWESPFSGHKESAQPAADAQKINWNLTFPRIYIQFLFEYSIIAVFKIKASIHKSETTPHNLFELLFEMHIESRAEELRQSWL